MIITDTRYEILSILNEDMFIIEKIGRLRKGLRKGCYTKNSSLNFVLEELNRENDSILDFGEVIVKLDCSLSMVNTLVSYDSFKNFSYCIEDLNCVIEKALNHLASQDKNKNVDSSFANELQLKFIEPYRCDKDTHNFKVWQEIMQKAEEDFFDILRNDSSKTGRILARAILPECLSVEVVLKANFRVWARFLLEALDDDDNPQLQDLFGTLADVFKQKVPLAFDTVVASKTFRDPYVQDSWDYDY